MEYFIQRHTGVDAAPVPVNYTHPGDQRPVALDVLHHAKNTTLPDLAYRYGCRNGQCGVCTVEINGAPRLACRARVNEADVIGPMRTLPHIVDFVVDRSSVNQLVAQALPPYVSSMEFASADRGSLNRCIECYACLSDCPMHQRNPREKNASGAASQSAGNPYLLLRLQALRSAEQEQPETQRSMLQTAARLGLNACLDCEGCRCQVGIDLDQEVIQPLLNGAAASLKDW